MAENLDPNMPTNPPSEIHKIEPAQPDINWARPDMPRASAERLKAPSSHVRVFNSSPDQVHIVQDRYLTGHELQPGQSLPMELLNEDITYFIKQRQPHSVARIVDGKPVYLQIRHPIEIQDEFGKPLRFREENANVNTEQEPSSSSSAESKTQRRRSAT